jgi:hypothetical protein
MKYLSLAVLGLLGLLYSVPDANAYVACARGYYWHHGGCVIVAPAPVVVAPVVPPVVVVRPPGPRCYWSYGRRVCRW